MEKTQEWDRGSWQNHAFLSRKRIAFDFFCLLLTLFGGNFRGKKGEVLPNPHLFNICLALSKAGICGKKSFRGGKGDFPQNCSFFL